MESKESQKHGFDIELIFLSSVFKDLKVLSALKEWKTHKKNYTSPFDIPDYKYFKGFFEKIKELPPEIYRKDLKYKLDNKFPISKEDYEKPFKNLGLSLPISIKAYKYTLNKNKKIEFGDAIRTIENLRFDNKLKEFSIVCFEWEQKGDTKKIKDLFFSKIKKENDFLKGLRENLKVEELNKVILEVKKTPNGPVAPQEKRKLREKGKQVTQIETNSYVRESGVKDYFLELRVKIDSKTQRRVQCVLSKAVLKSKFEIKIKEEYLDKMKLVSFKSKSRKFRSKESKEKQIKNKGASIGN